MPRASASADDWSRGDARYKGPRGEERRQVFNAIVPSPFREGDLDPRAEEFIVESARDLPATHIRRS